ncbi:DUF2059 domain-containing protein [Flagellimonas okinawensis]|uniref:DUF2059 domain-containing protein n=1 Tax=Flagellimonas okinawensis TaxID=3031324 RepID=A0ABT5XIT3_9FLAO|nr:DUF2059 domain-containing protein [[Muricauda] okinawensis]MDF0705790.1 DUF2059 domain-containing protein [[Muricauda] okinawensis]
MTKKLLIVALVHLLSFTAFGQTDGEYSKTLKRMFEVSGTEISFQTAIKQMFSMFREQYPTIETEIWVDLEKEFSKTSLNELTEMLVPVYSKHLNQQDLEDLIQFFETPVGKKYAASTPLILQESMQVGQQWGMKIGQDFQRKLQEKGY